jgi:hypothetical protein
MVEKARQEIPVASTSGVGTRRKRSHPVVENVSSTKIRIKMPKTQ